MQFHNSLRDGCLRFLRQGQAFRPSGGDIGGCQRVQIAPFGCHATMSHQIDLQETGLFFIPGSEAGYVKIFKGAEIQSGSEVISAMFNGAGQMTSENIPLEAFYHGTALKRPRSGFVTQALSAGELVSVVVYNADGSRSSV